MDNVEERLTRLENFIGNIDQIRLYANSLQQVLDRYLQPLYIEQGNSNLMIITDYLGDLNNIPRNVIFKIRASHNVIVSEDAPSKIIFQRGEESKEYDLRKMVDKLLVPLENSNYIDGEIYDVYINSQDIAVITANDIGVKALSEVEKLRTTLEEAVLALNNIITTNCNNLDQKIDTKFEEAKSYTDGKYNDNKARIDNAENILVGITRSGDEIIFNGSIIANYLETQSLRTTKTINMSGTTGFVLPSGTTIADPSANLGLANRQWVENNMKTYVDNYFSSHHYASTEDVSVIADSLENGSFYYKLSQ